MKNRSISVNIRTIDDLICLINSSNQSGRIVSLDFAKAFDSIDTGAIFSALKRFNFATQFINMTKTLIKIIKVVFKVVAGSRTGLTLNVGLNKVVVLVHFYSFLLLN